jgi:predicted alpha/beta superfamily hydrolase
MVWVYIMVYQIKWLLLAWLLVCFKLSAATAYELPRSMVIEVAEQSSGRIYPVFIQLPPSYTTQTAQTFPVIYLTDGPYSFPTVAGAMRFPVNNGVIQQAIIVAIAYEKGAEGSSSRIRDFTPTIDKTWKQQTGHAKEYLAFIRDTIMPLMEHRYGASQTDRTFVGHSLGGLLGAFILLTEPDLFSNYILSSPSVWFDDDSILKMPFSRPQKKLKVYLAVGEYETPAYGEGQDMVAAALRLKDKITLNRHPNIDMKFSIIAGANHATVFPTTAIQGLHWLDGFKRK